MSRLEEVHCINAQWKISMRSYEPTPIPKVCTYLVTIGDRDNYHTLNHKTFEFQVILTSLGDCSETLALNDRLIDLTGRMTELLNAKAISANQVVNVFPELPSNLQYDYFYYMKNKLMKSAYKSSSHDLFNCMHFGLLKVAIHAFGSKSLKDDADKIVHDVLSLRKKVTAEDFIERCSHAAKFLPPTYGQLQFHVNKEPEICTLQDVEDVRMDFIDEFMPKVSSHLVFLHQIAKGSSVVSLGVPRKASEEANAVILEDNDRSFFERHGIVSLSINENLAYSNSKYLCVAKTAVPPFAH